MTTIQELIDFGKTAGDGDQKSFGDLPVTVVKVEPKKDNEYGGMQRVQVKDGSGSWYFSVMDSPELGAGEQILASGVVKGNPAGKSAYFNVRSYQLASGHPPAQAPSGGGQRASGHERTAASAAKVVQWLWQESEGWGVEGEEARQKLVGSILIGYIDGKLALPDRRPGEQPQARRPALPPPQPAPPPPAESEPPEYEDDGDIPF